MALCHLHTYRRETALAWRERPAQVRVAPPERVPVQRNPHWGPGTRRAGRVTSPAFTRPVKI